MKSADKRIIPLDERTGGTGDEFNYPAKVTRPLLPGVFQRARLFDKLDRIRSHKVIWVAGPAGCGKTTLISTYLEARALPCMWYNVDERDLDPATFFYYMGLAAKRANPRKLEPLPFLTPEYQTGLSAFTIRYFEALYSRLKSPGAVVIDDYQGLSADAKLQELLLHALAPIPEGITVIILSREAPPWTLIRMRVNRLMEVLGWPDIRLTLEETAGIVGLQVKERFSGKKLQRIHCATGGWAAGLLMLLEGTKVEGFEPGKADDFTREEIFGYFAAEVFDKLDPETQKFFLKSAFLPHMTPKTASTLTGHAHAEQILFQLNRRHQFTERYGHNGLSYQYHPLFRQFLLSRAKEMLSSEEIEALRRDAGRILIAAGETEEAVLLLHDAKDWDSLVKLILNHAPSMMEQGRAQLLRSWLERLPRAIIEDTPWLLYWMGYCVMHLDPLHSQRYLERAFEKFRAEHDEQGVFLSWACIINSIHLGLEDLRPLSRWLLVLEELLQEFKDFCSQEIEANVIFCKLAALLSIQPGHPEVEALIEQSFSIAQDNLNNNGKIRLLHHVAFLRIYTGDFEKAADIIRKITQLASLELASPLSRITEKLMVSTYSQVSGRHEECMKAVDEGLEISRRSGASILDGMILGNGILSSLNIDDLVTARNLLENLASIESNFKAYDRAFFHYLRFHEALWLGDYSKAGLDAALALKFSLKVGSPFNISQAHLATARAMHELGKYEEAFEHLGRVFSIAEEINSRLMYFNALLNEAQFLMDNGKEKAGLKSLRKALEIGKARGYVTTYCIQPAALADVCIKALESGIEVVYVQDLIKRRNLVPVSPPLHLKNWPWPLKIYTLGRFSLLRDGSPVLFSTKAQKMPLKMIKALISLGGRDVSKNNVSDALWPDSEGDKADQAFATTLHRLRHLVGNEKAIQLQDGKLSLNPSCCWVDSWSFERCLSQADEEFIVNENDTAIQLLEEALDIYNGPFLANDGWETWAISQRERLRDKFLFAVSSLGKHFEAAGKSDRAVQCFFRALDADDISEDIYRQLMLCLKRLGHRAEALAVYKRLSNTLKARLGIVPSPKTESIYRSLVDGVS